jgi:hypothetical protein
MTNKDEIAALKARVEELERAAKPPAPPDMSDWKPINPIDRVSMPASAMRDMAAAIPDHVVRDIALRDCRAPTGPSSQGAIPSSQQVTSVRGTGWARERPIAPPPGIRYVDAQIDVQDMRDRKELIEKEQALLKLAESLK